MKPYGKYLFVGYIALLALLTAIAVFLWSRPRDYESHSTLILKPEKIGK